MTIGRLHRVLADIGLSVSARELTEILWLACQLTAGQPEPDGQLGDDHSRYQQLGHPDTREGFVEIGSQSETEDGITQVGETDGEIAAHGLFSRAAANGRSLDVGTAEVPTAPMLHDTLAIQRACRPLKRKVSSHRAGELDEDATARRIAEQPPDHQRWVPIMRPSPERWLSLAFVVDTGPSMWVWRPLARELQEAFTRLGAFRDLRVWYLNGDKVATTADGPPLNAAALLDASGRQACLVLSDCSGAHWWNGSALQALHVWGQNSPTAILQPLAERLWRRTAVPPIPGLAQPRRAAAPNTELGFTPYEASPEYGMPVPVLEISPLWLADWTRLLVGSSSALLPMAAAYVSGRPTTHAVPLQREGDLSITERVQRFQATASPGAVRLAAHVAVSIPTLPVMRLIHHQLLPNPEPGHIAEVLLSGLLRPVDGEPGRYEFVPGARQALLATLPRSESWHAAYILSRISAEIEDRAGRVGEVFRAYLQVPHGAGERALVSRRPFALVSHEALRYLRLDAATLSPPGQQSVHQADQPDDLRNNALSGGATSGEMPSYTSRLPLESAPRKHLPVRVAVGIDFGTYSTGFAWATVSEQNSEPGRRRISFFEEWAGQHIAYPKNRSAVLLDAAGQFLAWGDNAVAQMAAAPADSGWQLRTGFKMALQPGSRDPADPQGQGGAEAGVVLSDSMPEAYRLTVLCLRQVVARARERITAGVYEEDEIRWCITVPAIWDQYAQDLMLKAAVEAGLPDDSGRLLLVQEPAAAALYCKEKGGTVLGRPGTRFLVIDAGGGTVDISCYQVADDGGLSELAPAAGVTTGSEYLNAAFLEEILVERFGAGTLGRILAERRGAIADIMNSWERAKRSFSADSSEDVIIPLSASFHAGLMREQAAGRWTGTSESPTEVVVGSALVAELFERRIDETMACVERQLLQMRSVSGVTGGEIALLVGGFAESPYLRARLADRLAGQDVRVLVPEQPSVAVLAGAVLYACDTPVFVSWRAPFTLGVSVVMPFRPGKDPESRKKVNAGEGLACSGRFDIFFAAGEAIRAGEPVRRIYRPVREDQSVIMIQLLSTDRADVEYVDEDGVEMLATLTVDLSTSMLLPLAERRVEVAIYLDQGHIRVEARNVETDEQQPVTLEWVESQ